MRTQTEERGTITLNKPVLINGVQVAEMSYDTDEISGELYAQAEAHKMKASGSKGGNLAGAVELDYSLHLYIGSAAVIGVNPSYTFEDMERIKGKSITKFSKIGRLETPVNLRCALSSASFKSIYMSFTCEITC